VIHDSTGYLVDSANPLSLARTIQKMIDKKKFWKKFGDAGSLRYQRLFRGENSVKELVEKYFEL
jgi:glycosyltransferase involved in cell wall biosynthesis